MAAVNYYGVEGEILGDSHSGDYMRDALGSVTGTCSKRQEWASEAPDSVLELVRIPGVGAKTARFLFQNYGIHSLESLKIAIQEGKLNNAPGIGPKTLATMREFAENHT